MSVLMNCTPSVPQLTTMLVASAMLATAWNGVPGSPATMGMPTCHVCLRPAF